MLQQIVYQSIITANIVYYYSVKWKCEIQLPVT
jgi:hypothetical protein